MLSSRSLAAQLTFFERAALRLAAGLGGVQPPVVATPMSGGSFALGLANEAVRKLIKLPAARPFIERVTLVDKRLRDPSGLGRSVQGHLVSHSATEDAAFAFVDQQDLGE